MKRLFYIVVIGLFACGRPSEEKKSTADKKDKTEIKTSTLPLIGEEIQGNFYGDGQNSIATVKRVKIGKGNPVEDGTADEYEVQFSGKKLKSISSGCCEIRLINEGDLNNDGADEISIFQAPMNGCTYAMTTYSFTKGAWKIIIKTFLIPTGCEYMSDEDLQNRIFVDNSMVYFLDTDMADEEVKLIKKIATIE
ncbi:hypothetical protein [Flavobacterium sp. PL002]|uniref:hypothetical protein n=1 Tax=Flavobacterium sp. PL002 TaxID=1897058 RepID=UPI00178841D8|nr:hypothetical protein [Flavobacterium sp. PL002]MBE0391728.1 hypothetical protein [Flavobacterium sp. PL002]